MIKPMDDFYSMVRTADEMNILNGVQYTPLLSLQHNVAASMLETQYAFLLPGNKQFFSMEPA